MEEQIKLMTAIYSFTFLFSVIQLTSMWRIFQKANQPGWAAFVPFYNIIIWLKIIAKPTWWLILLFIPGVNIVMSIIMTNSLAACFGRSTGFTFGLIFLGIFFFPILAFNDYEYSNNSESNTSLSKRTKNEREILMIWFLAIALFNGLFWFIFANFIDEWWKYFYISLPLNVITLFTYFLIGISANSKYRTATIVLSICFIITQTISNIYPILME